jgi:iron complex transport system substrate-binding protein
MMMLGRSRLTFGTVFSATRIRRCTILVFALVLLGCDGAGHSDEINPVTESAENIPRPARRIISLAPHLTELVYTAGAGDRLVGVVAYSDYPPEAAALPLVGDAFRLDYEIIAGLQPDLILGWSGGSPLDILTRLNDLGYRVVTLEIGDLGEVAANIRRIGQLAGSIAVADQAAEAYENSLAELRRRYENVTPVKVFYQVAKRPLITITRQHAIGQVIETCGGHNVFGDLGGLSPTVSVEAVIQSAPEVIVAGSVDPKKEAAAEQLADWNRWSNIPAVRHGNLIIVDANQISRSSTRILVGIEQMCEQFELARDRAGKLAGQQPAAMNESG